MTLGSLLEDSAMLMGRLLEEQILDDLLDNLLVDCGVVICWHAFGCSMSQQVVALSSFSCVLATAATSAAVIV